MASQNPPGMARLDALRIGKEKHEGLCPGGGKGFRECAPRPIPFIAPLDIVSDVDCAIVNFAALP